MSTQFTLEQLLDATELTVIDDVECLRAEYGIAGDKDCAAFHMADETTIFFDPSQQVTLEDGKAVIRVTYHGDKTRTETTALFFTYEKVTAEKVLAKIQEPG